MGILDQIDNGSQEEKMIVVLVVIIMFFLLRELNTWYWKINEVVDKLDDISKTLHRIEENNINIKLEKPLNPNDDNSNKRVVNETCKINNEPMGEDIIIDDWMEDKPEKSISEKIRDILNTKIF